MSGGRGRACRFLAHFAPRMPIIGRINTENGAIKNARGEDNLHDSEFYPEGVTILINCCLFFLLSKRKKRNRSGSRVRTGGESRRTK